MYDVITFGSAAWDVFLKLDKFKTIKSNKFARGQGLCLDLVSKTKLKPTNYSVILNTEPEKNKTVLAYRGASDILERKDIPWNKIKTCLPAGRWFYLAPLSGKTAGLTEYIINFAHKNKIKIAFNPGKFQLSFSQNTLNRILKKVDVLFLNREEASLLTKLS